MFAEECQRKRVTLSSKFVRRRTATTVMGWLRDCKRLEWVSNKNRDCSRASIHTLTNMLKLTARFVSSSRCRLFSLPPSRRRICENYKRIRANWNIPLGCDEPVPSSSFFLSHFSSSFDSRFFLVASAIPNLCDLISLIIILCKEISLDLKKMTNLDICRMKFDCSLFIIRSLCVLCVKKIVDLTRDVWQLEN